MNYLIDTNVISEVRKGSACNPRVAAWYGSIDDESIYLSALVLGEIRKGIERARPKEPAKALGLEKWLSILSRSFAEHILPVDRAVVAEWGRMSAKRPVSTVDALLAATAKVHGMTLATRNTSHVTDLGANVFNPFEAAK
ncbi:MAG: type II toxin-antitoxin system VapC family toxin [Xanthobacteraceae bacterium]